MNRHAIAPSLRGVFVLLDYQTREKPPMVPCRRELPDGTTISMRRKETGKLILTVERADRPAPDVWEAQLYEVMVRCGIPTWHRVDINAPGRAAEFHEEQPGQRCRRCNALLDAAIIGIADVCVDCALAAKRSISHGMS